jgi:hypothetical protein
MPSCMSWLAAACSWKISGSLEWIRMMPAPAPRTPRLALHPAVCPGAASPAQRWCACFTAALRKLRRFEFYSDFDLQLMH